MIDSMNGTFLKLHACPRRKSIVIDRPNEGGANAGSAVIRTGGRYLMYYRGMKADAEDGVSPAAESEDGINWTKREITLFRREEMSGLIHDRESRKTNALNHSRP